MRWKALALFFRMPQFLSKNIYKQKSYSIKREDTLMPGPRLFELHVSVEGGTGIQKLTLKFQTNGSPRSLSGLLQFLVFRKCLT